MFQIYLKELLELVRDKKTLFFVIALPLIIFPVMFGLMGLVVANVAMEEHKKVLNYALINGDTAPEFTKAINYHRDFKLIGLELTDEKSIKQAIASNQVALVIEIPRDFSITKLTNEQAKWTLYFNDSSQINSVKAKVNKVFETYVADVRNAKLDKLGITMQQLDLLKKPINLITVNTADKRENFGEKVGGFIPYMLIILCMTGAMYPAIDIGAGEKERNTLETLLLTPTMRLSLVLGKFFTIMTTGVITAMITVTSLVFWSYLVGEVTGSVAVKDVMAAVAIIDVVLMIVMLLPVSAIFAAVLLSISIYAKSYKEAQNYMGPMSIFAFMPVMIVMLPGIKLDSFWAFVPISNVALAIKEILKGTIEYSMVFYIFISSLVVALLALWFCVKWFNRESVLFR